MLSWCDWMDEDSRKQVVGICLDSFLWVLSFNHWTFPRQLSASASTSSTSSSSSSSSSETNKETSLDDEHPCFLFPSWVSLCERSLLAAEALFSRVEPDEDVQLSLFAAINRLVRAYMHAPLVWGWGEWVGVDGLKCVGGGARTAGQ
jgi:hypothetical protein